MSEKARSVLEAALELPQDDRSYIIGELAKSLPPSPIDSLNDDELAIELERRSAEFTSDPSVATRWKDFDWDENE